jgi:cell division septation protein DedD
MKTNDSTGVPEGDGWSDDGDRRNRDHDALFGDGDFPTSVQQAIEDEGILDNFTPGRMHHKNRDNHEAEALGDMFKKEKDPVLGGASRWNAGSMFARSASRGSVPLWLLGAAAVSVLLLGLGGYGVVAERSELRRQVDALQAAAGESMSPAEAAGLRAAAERLTAENDELRSRLGTAEAERADLAERFATLEAELEARSSGLAATMTAVEPARPDRAEPQRPEPAAKPAPKTAAKAAARPAVAAAPAPAPVEEAGWFVNFSSSSSLDRAEAWAARLEPEAGTVTINPVDNDGRTLYRLRVVGLANRSEAVSVARDLERAHGLDSLWIGNQ